MANLLLATVNFECCKGLIPVRIVRISILGIQLQTKMSMN